MDDAVCFGDVDSSSRRDPLLDFSGSLDTSIVFKWYESLKQLKMTSVNVGPINCFCFDGKTLIFVYRYRSFQLKN